MQVEFITKLPILIGITTLTRSLAKNWRLSSDPRETPASNHVRSSYCRWLCTNSSPSLRQRPNWQEAKAEVHDSNSSRLWLGTSAAGESSGREDIDRTMNMTTFTSTGLSPAAVEVLGQLFVSGPTWDGNICSKAGRGELCQADLAFHAHGWASLTAEGIRTAIEWDRHSIRNYDRWLKKLRDA